MVLDCTHTIGHSPHPDGCCACVAKDRDRLEQDFKDLEGAFHEAIKTNVERKQQVCLAHDLAVKYELVLQRERSLKTQVIALRKRIKQLEGENERRLKLLKGELVPRIEITREELGDD